MNVRILGARARLATPKYIHGEPSKLEIYTRAVGLNSCSYLVVAIHRRWIHWNDDEGNVWLWYGTISITGPMFQDGSDRASVMLSDSSKKRGIWKTHAPALRWVEREYQRIVRRLGSKVTK